MKTAFFLCLITFSSTFAQKQLKFRNEKFEFIYSKGDMIYLSANQFGRVNEVIQVISDSTITFSVLSKTSYDFEDLVIPIDKITEIRIPLTETPKAKLMDNMPHILPSTNSRSGEAGLAFFTGMLVVGGAKTIAKNAASKNKVFKINSKNTISVIENQE